MPRFAANLSMMYPDLPFPSRFAAASADGFRAVEFLFPYEFPAALIAERLRAHGLTLALFNGPPGDWAAGERGLAALPGREREFAAGVEQAVAYAKALDCRLVHFMAGLVAPAADRMMMHATYVANLRRAAARLAEQDLVALIEPINTRDMPGYFLNHPDEAHAILLEVDAPNLRLQFDFYHAQIVGGDLAATFERYRQHVAHVQIAGVPARNEPDTGEVNYDYLLDLLDRLGYDGWVGCEYRPARAGVGGTSAGLGWLSRWRR